jgi:hypothetical protein
MYNMYILSVSAKKPLEMYSTDFLPDSVAGHASDAPQEDEGKNVFKIFKLLKLS